MDFAYLVKLRERHAAWRLLRADSAPFIVSFLFQAFIRPNLRSLRQGELIEKLDDMLFQLRQAHGAVYPRSAQQYLDEWASGDTAYLRKYYPPGSDEPEYDLVPATEKVIEWLQSFSQRQFVGTESRLLTIYQLLRDIVQTTETDPEARITELERRKREIEREIDRLRDGEMQPYSSTQIKERFIQVDETARRLLSDFRQVEENFRELDRLTRERIATSTEQKGELLDAIFGEQNVIDDSDQGRSFKAFWTFLMSSARQDELNDLVRRVLALSEVRELENGDLLSDIKYHLMDAGEKVHRTSARLVEQLRKYLDDQVWVENKRIYGIIQNIERLAVSLHQEPPDEKAFTALDDTRPAIDLPMTRSLFIPAEKPRFDAVEVLRGSADFALDALFEQRHVDEQRLRAQIRGLLAERPQVTLAEVVEAHPLTLGLSEIIAYLDLASRDARAAIFPEAPVVLDYPHGDAIRRVTLPTVIYT